MRIAALNIHPLKGGRPVPVGEAVVDRYGLAHDRRVMLIDERGRFVSQRENTALATLALAVEGGGLTARAGGQCYHFDITSDGLLREVFLWRGNPVLARDQGDDTAAWFSERIGQTVRVVAFGRESSNPIDPDFTPRPDAETAFTDGYPLLVVNAASLDDLNRRLAVPVPMNRFRPSVVVEGPDAWTEDDWHAVRIGAVICDAVKPCARCVVTTTDQATGARDSRQEPLRTLATFRTLPGFGAIFGQNMVPRSTGILRVGDPVELL